MIRLNFRSSPWAAQAPLPGDAPSPPSPSAPQEFPSGPVHQKAILCLTEMDIDPNAMPLAQCALSRVTARLVTGFVTGFSQKNPGKMRFVTMSRVQGGYIPPHLAGAHSRQHATRYRPLDPITSGSLPPSGSWVGPGAF